MNRIPLEAFLKAIPKTKQTETGIKFIKIYNGLLNSQTGKRYNKNNALRDLAYYVELGNFYKIQIDNHQPQYYQTNINNYDYLEESIKPLLDRKFKTITDNWNKLDKKKLFLKSGKPSKKLEKWIEDFDSIIAITQNLMWSRETMKDEALNKEYSLIIKDTIKGINKSAKLVYSTSKVKQEIIQAVFSKIPFQINL
jgi:hypothetical protein